MKIAELRTLCPLFEGIGEKDFEALVDCLAPLRRCYAKGAYVFKAGDGAYSAGIVLSGNVRVIQEDFWGHRFIVTQFGPGEPFGVAFSCTQARVLPFSLVAESNTEVLLAEIHKILTQCSHACVFHGRMVKNMAILMAERNAHLTQRLQHLSHRNIRTKLLFFLSDQARQAGYDTVTIPFNRQELADYLCVDRSALSRELGLMRKEGLLKFEKDRFTLLR